MRRKTILILGGGGFLGTALSEFLFNKGYKVHLLGPHIERYISCGPIFHQGNMNNRDILEKLLPDCGTVFHMASGTTPGISANHPLMEAQRNITASLAFLEIFQNFNDIRLIFVSSGGTLYGCSPKETAVNETHSLSPCSYHGAGKVAIESFLTVFSGKSKNKLTILRPSNIYGPDQPLRKGFGVIRTMLEHIKNDTQMQIWGDGKNVRDFLYIQDMVAACTRLIENPDTKGIFNIGSGIGHSLNQVKELSENICGKPLKIRYLPEREVDVKRIVLNCSKINKKLKWESKISLHEGIYLTWQWLRKL